MAKGELPNLLPYIRVSSNDSVTVGVCGGCSQEPRLGVVTHTQLPEQGVKYRSTRTPLEFTSFDERPCFQASLKLKRLEVADEHERVAYAAAWAGPVPDRSFKLFSPPAGALPVRDLFSLVGFPSLSGQLALERRRLDAVFSCLLGQQQGLLDVSAPVTTQQPVEEKRVAIAAAQLKWLAEDAAGASVCCSPVMEPELETMGAFLCDMCQETASAWPDSGLVRESVEAGKVKLLTTRPRRPRVLRWMRVGNHSIQFHHDFD